MDRRKFLGSMAGALGIAVINPETMTSVNKERESDSLEEDDPSDSLAKRIKFNFT